MSVIGTPVRRREDYRFITGQGTYTDDINRPGQLYAYILRSPHANARITGIDTAAAASAPGVVAVYTGKDMAADEIGGLPCGWQIHSKDGSPMVEPPHPPLVTDRVRYVGQIGVVKFDDPQSLVREGSGLYSSSAAPVPAESSVVQGMIEGSNVQPVLELTRMMQTLRDFQAAQQVVDSQHEMSLDAINKIAKV